MDRQLWILRVVHGAMVIAAILYVWLAEILVRTGDRQISETTYSVIALMAAWAVGGGLFVLRPRTLERGTEALRMRPDDAAALKQWRAGYIIMFGCSEAVVLYGFLARILGASLQRAAPFYVVGIGLLLAFYPRRPS